MMFIKIKDRYGIEHYISYDSPVRLERLTSDCEFVGTAVVLSEMASGIRNRTITCDYQPETIIEAIRQASSVNEDDPAGDITCVDVSKVASLME